MAKEHSITRRELLRMGAALGALGLLGSELAAGCAGSSGNAQGDQKSGPSGAGATAPKVTKLDLAVSHWPSQFRNLPWAVGMQKGIFAKHGLEVGDILTSTGGGQTLRNMSLGNLPFSDGSAPAAISAFQAGIPLQIVGTTAKLRGSWMALPDSKVHSVMDLKGLRLGYTSSGSVTHLASFAVLGDAGIVKDVELVAIGGMDKMLPALQRGVAHVVLSPPNIKELVRQGAVKEVIKEADVLPDYVDTSLIASGLVVRDNPKLIQEVVQVKNEAVDWILNNKDAALEIYAKGANVDIQVAKDQYEISAPLDSYFDVRISAAWLKQLQSGMFYAGLLADKGKKAEPIQWAEIINQDFLPDKLRTEIPKTIPLPA